MLRFALFFIKNKLSEALLAYIFYLHWNVVSKSKTKPKKLKDLKLMFGHDPLISNKYWSNALKKEGFRSETLMETFYETINSESDYDLYFNNVIEKHYKSVPNIIKWSYRYYFISDYLLKNYDVVHLCLYGSVIEKTRWKHKQIELFKKFKITTVVIPYGGDYQIYSQILNPSMRQALLISYPATAKMERSIKRRLDYWTENADVFFCGFQIDGIGRWDIAPFNMVTIDEEEWVTTSRKNMGNGWGGEPIVIVHSPNHRGVKGTEFIIDAIKDLKMEGLNIQLVLLEGVQNSEVNRIFSNEADILVEQLMGGAYALSAIEGMASGIAVITNLQEEIYSRLFRRFSYLNECPILSGAPENIKDVLRVLINNPELRQVLGQAGRKYVEKYHSNKTAQYMFSEIYDHVIFNNKKDLINMFHPLKKNSYNNQSEIIRHPLIENKIPASLFEKLNK